MGLDEWRDLVIIVWGTLGIILTIMFTVVLLLIYGKVSRILNSAKNVAAKVEALTNFATNEVAKPIIQAITFIKGITCGFRRNK